MPAARVTMRKIKDLLHVTDRSQRLLLARISDASEERLGLFLTRHAQLGSRVRTVSGYRFISACS